MLLVATLCLLRKLEKIAHLLLNASLISVTQRVNFLKRSVPTIVLPLRMAIVNFWTFTAMLLSPVMNWMSLALPIASAIVLSMVPIAH